jgi:hypothetical protein
LVGRALPIISGGHRCVDHQGSVDPVGEVGGSDVGPIGERKRKSGTRGTTVRVDPEEEEAPVRRGTTELLEVVVLVRFGAERFRQGLRAERTALSRWRRNHPTLTRSRIVEANREPDAEGEQPVEDRLDLRTSTEPVDPAAVDQPGSRRGHPAGEIDHGSVVGAVSTEVTDTGRLQRLDEVSERPMERPQVRSRQDRDVPHTFEERGGPDPPSHRVLHGASGTGGETRDLDRRLHTVRAVPQQVDAPTSSATVVDEVDGVAQCAEHLLRPTFVLVPATTHARPLPDLDPTYGHRNHEGAFSFR